MYRYYPYFAVFGGVVAGGFPAPLRWRGEAIQSGGRALKERAIRTTGSTPGESEARSKERAIRHTTPVLCPLLLQQGVQEMKPSREKRSARAVITRFSALRMERRASSSKSSSPARWSMPCTR